MKHKTRFPLRYVCLALAVLLLSCLVAVAAVAAEEETSLSSYSVTLGEDIGLNVYVEATDGADVSVAFTYRGTRTVVSEATKKDDLLCYTFHGVLPQHLGEPIAIEVSEQSTVVETRTVSVAEYCKALSADGTRATAEAVLLYGAAARRYTALADTTDLSALPAAEDIAVAVPVEHPTAAADAAFLVRRFGLILSNNVHAYLDVEATGGETQPPSVTVFIGSGTLREAAVEPLETAGIWRVSFPLKASELLDTSVSVSVQGATGGTDRVTFGAAAYLRTVALGEDAALSTLARAIYQYAVMANDLSDGHSYETVDTYTATCGKDGITVKRCTVCGDIRSTVTSAPAESIRTTVENGKAILSCATCGDRWTAEVSAYATGDETSANFVGSSTNITFAGGAEQLPIYTEDGNSYYAFVRQAGGTKAQAQFYGNSAGADTETTTRHGFVSIKLKQPEKPLDDQYDWSLQLFNVNGTWGAYSTVNAKGFAILGGLSDGSVYATDQSKTKTETLAKLSTSDWTRFDILFEKNGNDLTLTYYVNGQLAFTQTLTNTLRAKTPCGIYFTTYSEIAGASFYFDDVIFAYSDTACDSFLPNAHKYETLERVEPTCYEEGYAIESCADCHTKYLVSLAPVHDLTETSRTEPSCMTDGVRNATCALCGLSIEEPIPALGKHSYGSWQIVTAPSATAEGLQQRTCSVCGGFEKNTIPRATINTLYMTGDYTKASKTDDVTMQIDYVPLEGEGFSCYGTIHWQGATSASYPEKNYTLKLYKDETLEKKNKVDLGWGKESKYCLKANWVDCTSARNVVACRLWGDIVAARTPSDLQRRLAGLPTNGGAIDGFPIAVYMNGEFHGLYTLNVPKDDWMLGMDDGETEAILMGENWNTDFSNEVPGFYMDSNGDWKSNDGAWELKYFGTEKTTGDTTWVKESFNALIRFARDKDGDQFREGIDQYLDVDATIDYLLYMYAIFMRDNSAKNILWATYDGKVWFPTIYDQDGTFGMVWDGMRKAPPTDMLPKVVAQGDSYVIDPGTSGILGSTNVLFPKLLNLYPERVLDRYYELRESVLTETHMKTAMTEFLDEIPDDVLAADREKWDKPGVGIFEWEYIEQWIPQRLDEMDKAMAKIAETVGYVKK